MVDPPLAANEPPPPTVQVAVKTTDDPRRVAASLRDLVRNVSADAIVDRIRTMEDQINASLVRERGLAWLSAAFAALASVVACLGLYGVMSYRVVRRTREIGIRLAIGAQPWAVLAGELRHAMVLVVAGLAIGQVSRGSRQASSRRSSMGCRQGIP